MFSRIKAWGKYALKIFKPCGISSLSEDSMPANSAIPTTGAEHLSTTTVATTDSTMAPIVAESQIIQAPQPSAGLPNDPDRIHSESAIHAESVPISIIHKARSDTLEAANLIALATEESASDMVISGCQAQQDSIKDVSAKIKDPMDSGVDISTGPCPIKDFVYYDNDRFTFISHISIDGIYDGPTNCIVVYDKNDVLQIHEVSDSGVSPPHQVNIHPVKSIERYYCRDRPVWTDKCPYEYIMCVISENDTCPDNIQRIFICASSEEETDELLTCFMNMLSKKEEEELDIIDH
ncbi:hypothetical protein BASA50_001597 [Batrachochytrium salamandrivorans]|uniref:Uncharacterized protein n=1 Tax=Batrachochytrium salamandrivorans TaxID=1357716 RepID=A0ABQ8FNN7_9FUNG|nr:hypothetical protein BASA50_007327 [Batrachochytrium salamandrivorans]KAH6601454.1 hypothetical protein BASA50_001597 [Batrachochytrium salamandrivorans]